jgi:hypothetical protein
LLLFYLVIREGVREGMRRALRDHELERAERRREEQRRRVSGAVSTSTPPRRPAVAAGASAGAVAAPASAAQAVGSAGSAVAGRPAEPGTLTGGMRLPRRLWGLRSLRARLHRIGAERREAAAAEARTSPDRSTPAGTYATPGAAGDRTSSTASSRRAARAGGASSRGRSASTAPATSMDQASRRSMIAAEETQPVQRAS